MTALWLLLWIDSIIAIMFDLNVEDFLRHLKEEKKKALYDLNNPPDDEIVEPLPSFVTAERLERIMFDPACSRTLKSSTWSMECFNDYPSNGRKTWRTIITHAALHPLGLPITIPITWADLEPFQLDLLIVSQSYPDGSIHEHHIKIIQGSQSEGGFVTARIAPNIVELYRCK